jgi:GntR family transcriptional regulator/MocR family aminotransferase
MLRPWVLNIEITRDSKTAIHVQITQKIIDEIQQGRFTVGSALPGTRQLANLLEVNRKTVIQAYDELVAQGWLISEKKRGTFVSSRINSIQAYTLNHNVNQNKKCPTHDVIHFTDGLSDASTLPLEILSRVMRHALIAASRQHTHLDQNTHAPLHLREAIAQMLNMERGLHTKPEQICLVQNNQMGLYVIASTLIHAGDHVIVEQLSNPSAREAFKHCGAAILNVTHDDEGIDVAHIEQLCIARERLNLNIRAVYVMPHHHIPTTVTLSTSRRKKLISLAEQYDFMIIEDDVSQHFNFVKPTVLPMRSAQNSKHVIYLGELSKQISPNLGIGYIVAEAALIKQCAEQVERIHGRGNSIAEFAITELLQSGEIKKHIRRTQSINSKRRTILAKTLEKELGSYMHFVLPNSGLAFWLNIHPDINMEQLVRDADDHGVKIHAGKQYAHKHITIHGIRIGFAHLSTEEALQGVARLKKAFEQQCVHLLQA